VAASPTLDLTRELIARASVTPADAGCQRLIGKRLQALGFELTELRFGEVDNLWACRGHSGPLFVFAGHTDVVPAGPESQWHSAPFVPTVAGDYLYGRGSADMKGSLAAMVVACEQFLAANPEPEGRIGFLLTSDEEGPATEGTVKVMEYLSGLGIDIDWCLVGEPSSSERLGDVIRNGRRGSLGARLTVRGIQGHVAYPQLVSNPIHNAIPALAELAGTEWDRGNTHFPATSFQVTNIHAGTGATNVVPGELELLFNFRFSTESTAERLQRRCTDILDRHGLDYRIEWTLHGEPFLTQPGTLTKAATAAVRAVCGVEPELSTGGGTSDGRFIAPYGAEVIELGPVNATIHKVDECVNIADLDLLARVYCRILQDLLEPAR